jgi:hypothetical protein
MLRHRRWVFALVIVAAVTLIAEAVQVLTSTVKQRGMDAKAQAAVLLYSWDLKSGATRKEVEDYLRTHGSSVVQSCCYEESNVLATLSKVGDAPVEFFTPCNAWRYFVAFEFTPVPKEFVGII